MIMKKTSSAIFLLLFLFLSFIRCEKDKTDLLLGQWEGISERTVNYIDNQLVHDSTYTYEPEEFVMEILDGGTCKIYKYGKLDKTWGWKVDDDIFSLIQGNNSRGAKYIVSETSLTMDFTSEWKEQESEYKRIFYYVFRRISP